MFKIIQLTVLCSITSASLYAQLPYITIPIENESKSSFFSSPNQLNPAPQITSVRVLTVSSSSSLPEIIGEGQIATTNHHEGTATITTLEVGVAHFVSAAMNGIELTNNNDKINMCQDNGKPLRLCRAGEHAVAYIRTWTIKNIPRGIFTYQATSTNSPYRKESMRLIIN